MTARRKAAKKGTRKKAARSKASAGAGARKAAKKKPATGKRRPRPVRTPRAEPGEGLLFGLFGRALSRRSAPSRLTREAGHYVRELRQLAGLTVDEVADAMELADHSLLEAVENGTATLSFELILRLASIVARHDPVPVVTRLTRDYNPTLWKTLDGWGVARLGLQFERERSFGNIYRARDAARQLSDAGFDRVLAFTRAAFEMALFYAAEHEGIDLSESEE